jgi:hypothetical protein
VIRNAAVHISLQSNHPPGAAHCTCHAAEKPLHHSTGALEHHLGDRPSAVCCVSITVGTVHKSVKLAAHSHETNGYDLAIKTPQKKMKPKKTCLKELDAMKGN